jgi:hypothetical protein
MKKIAGLIILLGLITGCEKSELVNSAPDEYNVIENGPAIIVPDDYPTVKQATEAMKEWETICVRESACSDMVYVYSENELNMIGVMPRTRQPVVDKIRVRFAVLKSAF